MPREHVLQSMGRPSHNICITLLGSCSGPTDERTKTFFLHKFIHRHCVWVLGERYPIKNAAKESNNHSNDEASFLVMLMKHLKGIDPSTHGTLAFSLRQAQKEQHQWKYHCYPEAHLVSEGVKVSRSA